MAFVAVACGLIAAISWGYADYLAAKAAKRFGGLMTGIMVMVISALVFDLVYLFFFRSHTIFDATGIGYALASGVAFVVANLSFYKGLEYGPVSIVSPLGSLYPLVTTLLLVGLFGNVLTVRQAVGAAIVMGGIMAASGLFGRAKDGRHSRRGPLLGLVGALFWGLAWSFIAQAIEHIGWQFTASIELTISALLLLPLWPWLNRSEPGLSQQLLPSLRSPLMLAAGTIMMCGFLALSVGLDIVSQFATTALVLSACYPILTVFLALRRLKEKPGLLPLAGAFAGIAGVVILSLG